MEIRIELSRPFSLLLIIGAVVFGLSYAMQDASLTADSTAKGGEAEVLAIRTAEDDVRRARLESELADRHIAVLTYQLQRLENEREIMKSDLSSAQAEEYRKGLRQLVDLIEGKRRADDKMVQSFREMWEADRAAIAAAALSKDHPDVSIIWPVEPVYGISALFQDEDYEKIFGLPHNAIDIPALQSTPIGAADDGVVETVVDNGMGYSYITVRHDGYATLYGHISAFMVEEGQAVSQGDIIALSGGMPGTKGAGHLTTGPHVHFELITGEGNINPLPFLPAKGARLRQ